MSTATLWKELVGRTLLGTVRNPAIADLESPWNVLGEAEGSPAEILLDRLAALAPAIQAGRIAAAAGSEAATPPADLRPCTGQAASDMLQRLLEESNDRGLLPEWLSLCHAQGKRPPPSRLPVLLQLALRDTELRPAVHEAAGPLLGWLVSLDPRLSVLDEGPIDPMARWDSQDIRLRVSALGEIRARDSRQGLELLRATWKAESAEGRSDLLEALATGLGPDDEAFLESCLDDRSRAVRGKAAEIVAGLEGSACAIRLSNALSSFVKLSETKGILGLGRKLQAEVTLPPLGEPVLERDLGIAPNPVKTAKPVQRTGGERSQILSLLIARTSLGSWEFPGRTRGEVLQALRATDFFKEILDGLQQAVLRHRDLDWAEFLLGIEECRAAPLLALLPTPRRRQLLLERAEKGEGAALGALLSEPGQLDADQTRALLPLLRDHRKDFENHWSWETPLHLADRGDMPTLLSDLPRWRALDPSGLPGWIPRWIARIELRHALHQAFAKDATP